MHFIVVYVLQNTMKLSGWAIPCAWHSSIQYVSIYAWAANLYAGLGSTRSPIYWPIIIHINISRMFSPHKPGTFAYAAESGADVW